jgi:hypothetical protein
MFGASMRKFIGNIGLNPSRWISAETWRKRIITRHNNVEQACANSNAWAFRHFVDRAHNICCPTLQCLGFKDIFIHYGSDN